MDGEAVSMLGAGVGVHASVSTSSVSGVTGEMFLILSTICPIGPNIMIKAHTRPATQLTFPHGIAGCGNSTVGKITKL